MPYYDIKDISPVMFIKKHPKLGLKLVSNGDTGICHFQKGKKILCGKPVKNLQTKQYYYYVPCYNCMKAALAMVKKVYGIPDHPNICPQCGEKASGFITAELFELPVDWVIRYSCGYCYNTWEKEVHICLK